MASSLHVIGAGGHAKVVIATAQAAGVTVTAVYDDDDKLWGKTVLGVRVVGATDLLERDQIDGEAVIAVGCNSARKNLAERLSCRWAVVVHPSALVHETVRLGAGTVVFAGTVIQPDARLGAHVIANTAASIDHDCQLGDFVHVAPGAHLAGNVTLGDGAFLGIGSAVIPGRTVGAWTTVGAGGVVVSDLPAHSTAIGVPARPRGIAQ